MTHALWLIGMAWLALIVSSGVKDITVIYLQMRRERLRAQKLLAQVEAESARIDFERTEIERVRNEAARLNRETIAAVRPAARWTREDHVNFAESLGWDRPDTSKN